MIKSSYNLREMQSMKCSVFAVSSTFALLAALFSLPSSAGALVLSNICGWKIVLNLNDDCRFNRCIKQSDQVARLRVPGAVLQVKSVN